MLLDINAETDYTDTDTDTVKDVYATRQDGLSIKILKLKWSVWREV